MNMRSIVAMAAPGARINSSRLQSAHFHLNIRGETLFSSSPLLPFHPLYNFFLPHLPLLPRLSCPFFPSLWVLDSPYPIRFLFLFSVFIFCFCRLVFFLLLPPRCLPWHKPLPHFKYLSFQPHPSSSRFLNIIFHHLMLR